MKNKKVLSIGIIVVIAVIIGICLLVFNAKTNKNEEENTAVTEQTTLEKVQALERQIEQKEAERANLDNELSQMYDDLTELYNLYNKELEEQFQNQ